MTAPLYKYGVFGDEASLIVAFLIGIGFGWFLERAGFGSARKLMAQFYLTDMAVFKVMFTAVVTTMLGVTYLSWIGFLDLSLVYYIPTYWLTYVIGGLVLGAGFVIGGYCPGTSVVSMATGRIDGLVYVAGSNVKSDEVRAEYSTLHPLLRVATSVVFMVDPGSVITDAGRTPEDYYLWGLPVNEASLHFPQDDGFVHAVDLRTRGRPDWRNRGLELAFWAFGLHSLRHVGTADHLHVSLRLPGS